MKALAVEALLEIRDTGRKLLVSAKELVQQIARGAPQVRGRRCVENVHELGVVDPFHGQEPTVRRGAL